MLRIKGAGPDVPSIHRFLCLRKRMPLCRRQEHRYLQQLCLLPLAVGQSPTAEPVYLAWERAPFAAEQVALHSIRIQTAWGTATPNLEKSGKNTGTEAVSDRAFARHALSKSELTAELLGAAVTIADDYETPLHHGSRCYSLY